MNVYISGRNIEVTDDIQTHVERRADKIGGIFTKATDLHMVIEVEKSQYFTEISLSSRKTTFQAQADDRALFRSIDVALDRMQKQIRRHKSKVKNKRKRTSASKLLPGETLGRDHFSEDAPPILFHEPSKFATKPMTAEEAATELYTSEDIFLLFKNAKTDKVNLVYKETGKRYGLVEPQF